MTSNSEDESNLNLPSREQCQKFVEEFVAVTGTDEALAQFFLQDREWDLERSINAYFESKTTGGINVLNDGNEPEVIVTFDSSMRSILSEVPGTITTKPPDSFSLMTMNLDGLDHHNLKKRTKAVIKIIGMEKPDIVFLQEVIPATYSYMEENLPAYMFLAGGSDDYFIATLLYRTTVYFDGHILHPFPNSSMGRNMLLVDCHIGSLKLRLLNSHLESTADFAMERKEQLKTCFKHMKMGNKEHTSIFGGDLNLRDKEVLEVGMPAGVVDLWEACGKRPECKFTWDTMRNTNKTFPGQFKPRLRFDRVYLHQSSPPSVSASHFGLTGIQKVTSTQSFPSDHWGILINFRILNQKAVTSSPPPSYAATINQDISLPSMSSCNKSKIENNQNESLCHSKFKHFERNNDTVEINDSVTKENSININDSLSNDDSVVVIQEKSKEPNICSAVIDLE